MKNRKPNRLKGYDYSKNNLYFITNCVKNNFCCLGRVVSVGTGRDLSVLYPENHPPENHPPANRPPANHPPEKHNVEYVMELNQYGLIVEKKINWLSNQYEYVKIHNYQVMPNHFHFILEINSNLIDGVKIKSVSSLMGALKTTSSKLIHEEGFQDFEWHRSFHDNIIRDEKAYSNIFNYITNNPANWGKDSFYSKD
jgi:REP element-mobilizing transposase RayT